MEIEWDFKGKTCFQTVISDFKSNLHPLNFIHWPKCFGSQIDTFVL